MDIKKNCTFSLHYSPSSFFAAFVKMLQNMWASFKVSFWYTCG